MAAWKKSLLICVALGALMTPGVFSSNSALTSGQCHAGHSSVRYYYVYYRGNVHEPWRYYGYANNVNVAAYYVNVLRYYGYHAFYR